MTIITAVVFGGAGFYGGLKYNQSKGAVRMGNSADLTPEQRQQRIRQMGGIDGTGFVGGNLRGGQSGGGFIIGEIIAKDAGVITVKLRDGGSKIILYSASTDIGKFTKGTADDFLTGETVTVSGQTNQDGSITAQSIQVRPVVTAPSPRP